MSDARYVLTDETGALTADDLAGKLPCCSPLLGVTPDGALLVDYPPGSSAPLPTGAATEVTLSALNVKTPALGQALMAASVPVVLASNQSAVPVSGTVTTTPPANATTNVTQLAGTAISVNSGTKDAGTLRVILATDQPQLTNKLLVTPDANSAVNNAQVAGTAVSVNSGNKDAGTQRVVLATDQPNVPVNNAQISGTTVSVGAGATDSGTQRVLLVSEQMDDLFFTGAAAQTATVNNIIPSVASASATDVTGFSSGTIQLVSTASGGNLVLEGSNDNVSFYSMNNIDNVTNIEANTGSAPSVTLGANSAVQIIRFSIQTRYIRLRISVTVTGGSVQAFTLLKRTTFAPLQAQVVSPTAASFQTVATVSQSTASSLNATVVQATGTNLHVVTDSTSTMGTTTPGVAATNLGKAEDAVAASGDTGVAVWGVRRDAAVASASASGDYSELTVNKWGAQNIAPFAGTAKTYRGVANVASAVSATDIAILPGNASNTVYVTRVAISGVQTTAGEIDVLLIKRSTANSGGTSAAITAVPMDAGDAAASSAPLSYTANPTTGSTVGSIDRAYLAASPAATGTTNSVYTFDFGRYGKPVVLSGVAQGLAINLNGATVTGGTFTVIYEWIELP